MSSRRKMPDWLQNQNNTSPQKLQEPKKYKNNGKQIVETKSTNTRRSLNKSQNLGNNENIETENLIASVTLNYEKTSSSLSTPLTSINPSSLHQGRILRSQSKSEQPEKQPELKPSQYPFIEYKGDIKYFTDMIDVACACDELTNWVNKQTEDIVPIGFDMEWPFSFTTGPGKTAVIQICAEINCCYVFHVINFKKLPAALVALLGHKKVQLHGVNIKNDLRKLHRDFPDVNVEEMIQQCRDLGTWCNDVCNTGGRWSLERLVLYICKLRINKDKKVRMSKWHEVPLNDTQKLYAAIDVYISQVIYKDLQKRLQEKEKRSQEFLENFGEDALTAVQQLGVSFI